jgi:glyoxalase family protein
MDRIYFKSIYTNDPDGHKDELATIGPGFLIDEEVQTLGQSSLKLPPWLEAQRPLIEQRLKPVSVQNWEVA